MQLTTETKKSQSPRYSGRNLRQALDLQYQEKELPEDVPGNRKISLLVNGVFFFLETVFILITAEGYRLIVIHDEKMLTDETYKTPRGAKIAFLKLYGHKAWEEGVKPHWTPFFPPEENVGPLERFDKLIEEMER